MSANTTTQPDTIADLVVRLAAEHRTLKGNARWRGYADAKRELWAAALRAEGDAFAAYEVAIARYVSEVAL